MLRMSPVDEMASLFEQVVLTPRWFVQVSSEGIHLDSLDRFLQTKLNDGNLVFCEVYQETCHRFFDVSKFFCWKMEMRIS